MRSRLWAGAGFGLAFVLLTLWVAGRDVPFVLDGGIRTFFATATQDGYVDRLFMYEVASAAGHTWVAFVLLLLASAWLWRQGDRRGMVAVAAGGLGGMTGMYVLKQIVARSRPENVFLETYAFPSGHVVKATVVLLLIGFVVTRFRSMREPFGQWMQGVVLFWGALVALTVGFARLAAGVHWFSDVIGGYLFGLAVVFVTLSWYDGEWSTRWDRTWLPSVDATVDEIAA